MSLAVVRLLVVEAVALALGYFVVTALSARGKPRCNRPPGHGWSGRCPAVRWHESDSDEDSVEFWSAATNAVVEVGAEGSSLLVVASMDPSMGFRLAAA